MYGKIVVPLDGSKLAEAALPYAEEVAARMRSDIILFTVLNSEETDEYQRYHGYIKRVADLTRRHAKKYIEDDGDKAIKIGTATRVGSPAEAIIEYVSKGYSDLIVMASHGRSGISRWAIGSVADRVVKGTGTQPVMLIRAKESHSDIREKRILKKILAPLDGTNLGKNVLPCVAEIAMRLGAELTLFQVVPPANHVYTPESAETYLMSECAVLEEKGVHARYEVRSGEIADTIINFADEFAFDLVAMSTHGRGGTGILPLGSVAQKVFLGGNTPLLLVRY